VGISRQLLKYSCSEMEVINVVDGCTKYKKKCASRPNDNSSKARNLLEHIKGNLSDSEAEFMSSKQVS